MAKSKDKDAKGNFDEMDEIEDAPRVQLSVEDRVALLEMRVEALEVVARRHNGGTSLERAQKDLAAATENAAVEGDDNPKTALVGSETDP